MVVELLEKGITKQSDINKHIHTKDPKRNNKTLYVTTSTLLRNLMKRGLVKYKIDKTSTKYYKAKIWKLTNKKEYVPLSQKKTRTTFFPNIKKKE